MTHVDHCGDKEFRHLVADFEAQTNEPDSAKYHDSRANLQILCQDCNPLRNQDPVYKLLFEFLGSFLNFGRRYGCVELKESLECGWVMQACRVS